MVIFLVGVGVQKMHKKFLYMPLGGTNPVSALVTALLGSMEYLTFLLFCVAAFLSRYLSKLLYYIFFMGQYVEYKTVLGLIRTMKRLIQLFQGSRESPGKRERFV